MKNPIKYYGGKQSLSSYLLDYIPFHDVYVEVFGGAANLLIRKSPSISNLEVYNDINEDIVNLFRVIRSKKRFKEFSRRVSLMPYSRTEFGRALKLYRSKRWPQVDPIVRASVYFYLLRSSFSAVIESWSYSTSGRGISSRAYLSAINLLPELCERLAPVQIESLHFGKVLEAYDSSDTFFYLDPPYLASTRTRSNVYKHEMDRAEHESLLKLIRTTQAKILLSGYRSEVYDRELDGWNREEIEVSAVGSRSGRVRGKSKCKQTPKRIEVIWYNFDKPRARQTSKVGRLV